MKIDTKESHALSLHVLASMEQALHPTLTARGVPESLSGYWASLLCDPELLAANNATAVELFLHGTLTELNAYPGITATGPFSAQKERFTFTGTTAPRRLHLSRKYFRLRATAEWRISARLAELPAVLTRPGVVLLATEPLGLIERYLNMAEPEITADILHLLVRSILDASGSASHPATPSNQDADSLRRDFHAFGTTLFLLGKLAYLLGQDFAPARFIPGLRQAATAYVADQIATATTGLTACFQELQAWRHSLTALPAYIIHMPHGGILFPDEGYAEYDWPEAAVDVLKLYLRWVQEFGYAFAPDISAGTLVNLAATHPDTIRAFAAAWNDGKIEFVNGTWAQPYLQLWPLWDQRKQFELGLAAFEKIFGRRPTVYAAQEMALHPNLPGILREFGYTHAIHRAQNLGTPVACDNPLVNWIGHDEASLPTLPTHSTNSEKLGSDIYRFWPELMAGTISLNLPFAAITSLIDQTFVGVYQEECIRANRYAKSYGTFTTPSRFFATLSASVVPMPKYFALDDYDYELTPACANYHRYETTGSAWLQAHWNNESRRLQALEHTGALSEAETVKLLEGESHDAYILPYFKTGAFMELYLTDYHGPRYKVTLDGPRGAARYICDTVGLPACVEDLPPITPAPLDATGNQDSMHLTANGVHVALNQATGAVQVLNGRPVRLGILRFRGATFKAEAFHHDATSLVVTGTLAGFGPLRLRYTVADGALYCVVVPDEVPRVFLCKAPYWDDGVHVIHDFSCSFTTERHVAGVRETTRLPEFFSLNTVAVRTAANAAFTFNHGGAIFFRQCGTQLHQRLWCYEERASSFWWGVTSQ